MKCGLSKGSKREGDQIRCLDCQTVYQSAAQMIGSECRSQVTVERPVAQSVPVPAHITRPAGW
jgi:hypothetical protein